MSAKFTLPALPYAYNALEPYIDAKTMEIHHTKHHQAYIDKLNAALETHSELQQKTVEELLTDLNSIPEDIRTAVRSHGGGHYNHSLFWTLLGAKPGRPTGELAKAINGAFESFEKFQVEFNTKAAGVFGSGWTWLVSDKGKLSIVPTVLQDNPIMSFPKVTILLGLGVWEHAYYLKYQNKRPEYIEAWWNII